MSETVTGASKFVPGDADIVGAVTKTGVGGAAPIISMPLDRVIMMLKNENHIPRNDLIGVYWQSYISIWSRRQ